MSLPNDDEIREDAEAHDSGVQPSTEPEGSFAQPSLESSQDEAAFPEPMFEAELSGSPVVESPELWSNPTPERDEIDPGSMPIEIGIEDGPAQWGSFAEASPDSASFVPSPPTPEAVEESFSAISPEILEVFTSEAEEHITVLGRTLPLFQQQPANKEYLLRTR